MIKMSMRSHALAAAFGLLLAAGHSQAGILVDQSPPASDNAFFSELSFPQVVADDFTLASAGAPDSIVFWGTYFPGNVPLTPDLFSLAFYNDAAGSPGTLITSVAIAPSRVNIGPADFGTDIYEYNAGFSAVALGAGTFWVSIVNDSSANPGQVWAWSPSLNTFNSHFAFSADASRTPTNWFAQDDLGDLAFVLSENLTAVPEPSTMVAAGLGGLALLGIARRRKAK